MEGQARPQYHVMIRDFPAGERPRERLRAHGPTYLSNAELIAILLRTGTTSETSSPWRRVCFPNTVALRGWQKRASRNCPTSTV